MRIQPACMLLVPALFACHSADVMDESTAEVVAPLNAPPIDAEEVHDTIWSYLSERYDANGDGRLTRDEYDRDQWDRLDRNDDGVIEEADFARGAGGSSEPDPEMVLRQNTQSLVAWYFQKDDESGVLPLEELEGAIGDYDTSGDGKIDAEEFGCAAEERREAGRRPRQRAVRNADAWESLTAGLDANDDSLLGKDEIVAFFKDNDSNGDDVWDFTGGSRGGGGSRPMSGPAEGTRAPDFTLAPPEGGRAVTLSSFAGEKPVALIFGSYT